MKEFVSRIYADISLTENGGWLAFALRQVVGETFKDVDGANQLDLEHLQQDEPDAPLVKRLKQRTLYPTRALMRTGLIETLVEWTFGAPRCSCLLVASKETLGLLEGALSSNQRRQFMFRSRTQMLDMNNYVGQQMGLKVMKHILNLRFPQGDPRGVVDTTAQFIGLAEQRAEILERWYIDPVHAEKITALLKEGRMDDISAQPHLVDVMERMRVHEET